MFPQKLMPGLFFILFILSRPSPAGALYGGKIEHSVVPLVEQVEQIENLNPKKYSKEQFLEIQTTLSQSADKIRLVSYNVLFNLHDAKLDPQYRWPQRLPRIVTLLNELQADIVTVQEPYAQQVIALREALKDSYDFYPCNCGLRECNGMFIKRTRLEHLSNHSFSMKKAADSRPSARLTFLHLKDKKTGRCFLVANTHLSFSKVEQRTTQAHYIVSKLSVLKEQLPIFFTGDLNTFPHRLDLKSLPFYDGNYIERIFRRGGLEDARSLSVLGHIGPLATFSNNGATAAPFNGNGTPGVLLDHIYVTPNITVLIHAVQTALVDKLYASDHFPVFVDALIPDMPTACNCTIEPAFRAS